MKVARHKYYAGNAALDFANTVAWRLSERPVERLGSYDEFVEWIRGSGLIGDRAARALRRAARRAPNAAAAALRRAIDFRELCYRLFEAAAKGRRPAAAVVEAFNIHARRASRTTELYWSGDRFAWQRPERSTELEGLLEILVRAAIELLTSDDAARIAQCQDDRGCGWVFLDKSRSKPRRWCSMADCGNRAKARRFYRRSAER